MNIFLSFKEWFHILENNSQDQLQLDVLEHPKYPRAKYSNKFDVLVVKDSPSKNNRVYSIRDDLKRLGFRWDFPIIGYWQLIKEHDYGQPWGSLNLEDMKHLEDLNIDTSLLRKELGLPQIPKDPIAQQIGKVDIGSNETTKFYLATSKFLRSVPEGEPVVVYSDKDNWVYEDRYGNSGVIASSQIGNMIKRVTDKNGKPISGNNVKDLFEIFDEKFNALKSKGVTGDDESGQTKSSKKLQRPNPENVRIPPKNMTKYNVNIESKFNETNDNIMIDALAGTGKTTMLKHLSSFIKPGEKWLYLVFNKKNQIESENAFPSGIDVLTTHAFLGRILKENGKEVGGQTQLPPRGQKWKKIKIIIDRVVTGEWPSIDGDFNYKDKKTGEMKSPFNFKAKSFTIKLAELAKSFAIDPNQDTAKQKLINIIDSYAMDTDVSSAYVKQDRDYRDDMIEKCIEIMKLSMPQGLKGSDDDMLNYRDQDDTLWYAALHADKIRWNPNNYDVVLLDEVQDFNECQLIMAQKLKESGCRIICVGDPNQAMYGFRGANSRAFFKLKDIIGAKNSLSLPINFRSGGNIINWVKNNSHVENLEAAPHLKDKGQVYAQGGTHEPLKYNDFLNMLNGEFYKNKTAKESTAMICRTNGPLGHAALHFLKNDIDFQIIGKDLSNDLVDLIKKTTNNKPEYVEIKGYRDKLASYVEDLEDKWSNKISKSDELKELKEFASVLNDVHMYLENKEFKETEKSLPMRSVKDFQSFIEKKLGGLDPDNIEDVDRMKSKDAKKTITLTTSHKSKGLEWDRIFIMKPSQFSPDKPNIKTDEQRQQEENSWYVAATRGRNTLMVSEDDEPK